MGNVHTWTLENHERDLRRRIPWLHQRGRRDHCQERNHIRRFRHSSSGDHIYGLYQTHTHPNQVENEYSGFEAPYTEDFEYESTLMQDFVCSFLSTKPLSDCPIPQRDAGIKTPLITNDAWPGGHYTMVDIYGTIYALLLQFSSEGHP